MSEYQDCESRNLCDDVRTELTDAISENERLWPALQAIANGEVAEMPFVQTVARNAIEQ